MPRPGRLLFWKNPEVNVSVGGLGLAIVTNIMYNQGVKMNGRLRRPFFFFQIRGKALFAKDAGNSTGCFVQKANCPRGKETPVFLLRQIMVKIFQIVPYFGIFTG